jgi:plasminogen activator inhibitor 1 RNA-binding protein
LFSDSEKKEHQGWGGDEGKRELEAENQGATDAQTEAVTKDAEGQAGELEPEDKTKTYDEYLAERTAQGLSVELPRARAANEGADDTQWRDGVELLKKADSPEDWFYHTAKVAFSHLVTFSFSELGMLTVWHTP